MRARCHTQDPPACTGSGSGEDTRCTALAQRTSGGFRTTICQGTGGTDDLVVWVELLDPRTLRFEALLSLPYDEWLRVYEEMMESEDDLPEEGR